jgi:hypothetical protein
MRRRHSFNTKGTPLRGNLHIASLGRRLIKTPEYFSGLIAERAAHTRRATALGNVGPLSQHLAVERITTNTRNFRDIAEHAYKVSL